MSTNATALEVRRASPQHLVSQFSVKLSDYFALTKPEISFLIAIATFTGFYLSLPVGHRAFPCLLLIHTLAGTVFVAGGAATLNQYLERRFDAQMQRTSRRPLASGRLQPRNALCSGVFLSVTGAVYLAATTNRVASSLACLTLATYLLFYTPLKRKTLLCTLVGAITGAMPTLIGWAAASGKPSTDALGLYAILLLWQFPHFMAIAWMYREDYLRAGYRVLPRGGQAGLVMSWQAVTPSLILIPVSIRQVTTTAGNFLCSIAVGLLGAGFLYYSTALAFRRSNVAARRLLMVSIVYLPLLYLLFVVSKCTQ